MPLSSFSMADLYGTLDQKSVPPPVQQNMPNPMVAGNKPAGWFIGAVILLAAWYALTEWVL